MNGLALTREPTGAYILVGHYWKIPLTPQNKPSLPIHSNEVLSDSVTTKSDQAPSMLYQCPSRSPVPITLVNSVSLPGRTEAVVVVQVPKSAKDQLGLVVPTQNNLLPAQLVVAYSVKQAESRQVSLCIMNTSNCDITLEAGQKIVEYCPLIEILFSAANVNGSQSNNDKVFAFQTVSNMTMETELKAAISPSLNKYNSKIILDTLLKYPDVFNESLGYTDVITHKINMGNTAPIRQYPRRFPYAYREEVNKQMYEILEQGTFNKAIHHGRPPLSLSRKKIAKFAFALIIVN